MITKTALPIERFLHTLDTVRRERNHLAYSLRQLTQYPIDSDWVKQLDSEPDIAVQVEAFASRFGRMQDTIADKLLPRWLMVLAESPGSQIETLNRAERLGVLDSTERWLKIRQLRNRLVHEYMTDPKLLADALKKTSQAVPMLFDTYNNVREYVLDRLDLDSSRISEPLPAP